MGRCDKIVCRPPNVVELHFPWRCCDSGGAVKAAQMFDLKGRVTITFSEGSIHGWTFQHCICGFTLALTQGEIWWLKAKSSATRIETFEELLAALDKLCRYFQRLLIDYGR
jgi:hypothetical protein